MHYYRNNSRLDDGQMVLMDYAPEYHYYTCDIGRMWPVSGKFLPWQRELLQVVLEYRNAVLKRIKPGSPRGRSWTRPRRRWRRCSRNRSA